MILKLFSIRDAKAEKFYPPFVKSAHGEAERDFMTAVRDDKSTINKYPQDFDLYYLGQFNDEDGKMELLPSPEHMVKAIQFVEAR